ncbi:PSD1 and planctomycete cytochrome C domain-containing protein [Sphingobacterium sp. UDSM-2020]|uniref:PSD1 and planctomycete cytochrome C domain-containing protein n=1 Tax=Sphingobacterium sp. UDSM-2020 TaxID=2795738 RepID=UPI001937C024|nr:PSD1 and planctomycete cytochrome C domain-containing protein [Sphingobacterium sp. UDSM-2020]QQD14103.1 PSD1 domain-containing protein [Sphingobacterium sp. UDSM-2020]
MSEDPIPDSISYNFHVRPILSDKCFACHGPDANKRDADLRLDIPEEAYKALKSNATAHGIVPFKPKNSEVFLRISSKDTSYIMPPIATNLTLTATEIAIIEKWIKQGAKYEKHWAFTAPKTPTIPKVKDTKWIKNEIDYFVLDKLEHKKIAPNPEAEKERLLRRVSLDITGLPPSLQMMDKFMADNSPNAYEKVVESLMGSPAYGERMALHWMDVSRYADSHGYQDDNYRSQWPWRDWVIHAFNNNTPYNQFISWQLAGDLMPHSSKEQLLATAFNRNHKITEEGGVIDEEYRVEYVKDRTNTLGKAILGITLECAQCHDHKYDPFSQKEYFQMTAFFNNVKEVGLESTVGGPETFAKKPLMEISNADVQDILKFVNKQDTNKLIVSVMGDQDTLRKTYVLNRGVYDAHGEVVQASTPKSVLGFSEKYPKNRLGLTQWLFDKQNPLTSRVFVNQVWQEYFGRGLVKTSGDFGMQGELPSHPELLDWLAVDFMNHGWDIKRLVKQIVLSATYRQSAVIDSDKFSVDPDNIFLARAPRYRIPAEHVRDVVLSSSGLLVPTIGGPSVKPYQPAGLWEAATSGRGLLASYRQDHQASLYRRGLYTFIKRTVPPPVMAIFDASNRDQCEVKRLNTNTPLQALAMLNDPTVLEASRVLAARLLQDKTTPEAKITTAFRRIVSRKPKVQEVKQLTAYYADQLKAFKQNANADKVLTVGEFPIDQKINKTQLAALMGVITIIYNLEETITKS